MLLLALNQILGAPAVDVRVSWIAFDTNVPILEDTADGYWYKQWAKLHKKKKPKIEEVIELIQERPATALAEVKEAVKREYPQIDYTQVIKNVELQRFIAQQILITLELRRIAEDEDDIEMLLLL